MSVLDSVTMALKNIKTSKVRTFLTMLGIIIGVAAVIVIVGLGNGLQNYVTDSFASLGTNTLNVSVQSRGATRTLKVDDVYAIVEDNSEYLALCSPTASVSGALKIGTETITGSTVSGVSEDYFEIRGYEIAEGRGLVYNDIATCAKVCVVGEYLNRAYFDGEAVGQYLRLGYLRLKIIGVMAQESDDAPESGGTDDCVYLPYSTASRSSGRITGYVITARDEKTVTQSKNALEDALFDYFDSEDYYTVISMSEILSVMTSMIDIMVGVLAGIAAISLVVGGIGIMNIMLVSVTERTREIGIRKSLGAKERYILEQFIIEAATTSAIGGVLGIGFGYVLSAAATKVIELAMDEALIVTPTASAIVLAFGISCGIGVLFGFLPARKAARLNPIDALRYE
ncbi:MAG: ABC transporter permease [Oscillospiraceae bacterium]|nr:ABC transporter permease [Oscillospiraceae bacterium]